MSNAGRIEVPLFPLPNVVLFPGAMLPLHIFEERYKTMIDSCLEDDLPFGVVLFTGDQESVSSIRSVGVLARISEVERMSDGRMNIMTEGEARFRISRFTSRAPAWRAEVDFLDDRPEPDSVLSPLGGELGELYLEAYRKGLELTGQKPGEVELPTSATELSFMVSYVLDMGVAAQQELLETTSVRDRLTTLIEYLKEANRRLAEQVHQKKVNEAVLGNGNLGYPESSQ